MSDVGMIVVQLKAQAQQFDAQLNESSRHIREVGESSRIAAKENEGMLEGLKGSFGRGSTLEESMKLLRGAGVSAGFAELGNAMGDVAKQANEFKEAMLAGNADMGEMVNKLLQAIPIVSGFSKAGQGIRELFTGEQKAIDEMTASASLAEAVGKSQAAMGNHLREMRRVGAMAEAKDKIELMAKTNPLGADTRNQVSGIMTQIAAAAEERDVAKRQADQAYDAASKAPLKAQSDMQLRKDAAKEELEKNALYNPKWLIPGFAKGQLVDTYQNAAKEAAAADAMVASLRKIHLQTTDQADANFAEKNRHLQQMMEYVGGIKINPLEATSESIRATTKADYFRPTSLTPGIEKGQIQKTSLDAKTIQDLYNAFAPALSQLGINLPTTATIQ